jgi:hypothetical protein
VIAALKAGQRPADVVDATQGAADRDTVRRQGRYSTRSPWRWPPTPTHTTHVGGRRAGHTDGRLGH